MTSFQRQLNLYGFRRLTKGDDQGAYFHPKFQRGRKDLLNDIRRLPGKGSVPAVDYTGFEEFISNRISTSPETLPQITYNLRGAESDKSSGGNMKTIPSSTNEQEKSNAYAKSYQRSTRLATRLAEASSQNSPPVDSQTTNNKAIVSSSSQSFIKNTGLDTETYDVVYDNGNDVLNSKITRKRGIGEVQPYWNPASYQNTTNTSSIPQSYNMPIIANQHYNNNLALAYPKSKSKLTMNIQYEKIIENRDKPFLSSSVSAFKNGNKQFRTSQPSTDPTISSTLTYNETSVSPPLEDADALVGFESYEDYNRRQFDAATGKVVDLDQFDFDVIFSSQVE